MSIAFYTLKICIFFLPQRAQRTQRKREYLIILFLSVVLLAAKYTRKTRKKSRWGRNRLKSERVRRIFG